MSDKFVQVPADSTGKKIDNSEVQQSSDLYFTSIWQASHAYIVGDIVKPFPENCHRYICTVAGTSSSSPPTWPTTASTTVTDGGVTWSEYNTVERQRVNIADPIDANAIAGVTQNQPSSLSYGQVVWLTAEQMCIIQQQVDLMTKILVELRISNEFLRAGLNVKDDPAVYRLDPTFLQD